MTIGLMPFRGDALTDLGILDVFDDVSVKIPPVIFPFYQLKSPRLTEMASKEVIVVNAQQFISKITPRGDIHDS